MTEVYRIKIRLDAGDGVPCHCDSCAKRRLLLAYPGPPKCAFHLNEIGDAGCPHLKCTYDGMDGERYRCRNCGLSYFLDYEDMK